MTLRLGDFAPDFSAFTTSGLLHFHEWKKQSWAIFFSHPRDFTPVCTTELGRVAQLESEFKKRNVKVIALSVDKLEEHIVWVKEINVTQQCQVNFPIIDDSSRKISKAFDMIHPKADDTSTVRSVFVIDPLNKIRLILTYPASTGRNFDEILRVIDSLQLTDKHKVATPVNWKQGEEVIILPSIQDQTQINKLFPQGFRTVTPYLRFTKIIQE